MPEMKVSLPQPSDLSQGFSDLYGKTYRAMRALRPWSPTAKELIALATYGVQGEGAPASLHWLMDLPCAAGMAAALSMLPPNLAKASVAANKLSDALDENFREVMNVAASMIEVSDGRIVLQKVQVPPTAVAADLLAMANDKKRFRLDLTTDLQGYEPGKMMLVLV